jgi:glycosyltransferase involved in cell wall biosynthesis
MYKVGICGHFGEFKNLLNGQTVKTKILTEELKKHLGTQNVKTIDTHGWKENPFKLLLNSFILTKDCENVVIMPANNGLKIFVPLFLLFKKLFPKKKLHYVVIGGWLPQLLEKDLKLKYRLTKFDAIYVETYIMLNTLCDMGLNNIKHLPNFKKLNILREEELEVQQAEPYKLCTFSRVLKEKGIEDAIDAVIKANTILGRVVFTLDIYGQVDNGYKEEFENISNDFPEYISYKGMVNFDKSVEVLKHYYALIFPTHFKTEGIPGTIIDAYAAGIPVIASNWDSAKEIVLENKTGKIYEFGEKSKLIEILVQIVQDPKQFIDMKKNCLKYAKQYEPNIVLSDFIRNL